MNVQRLLLFAGVVLLAAFFRLHQLDTIPPGLFIDEAQDGLDASAIQHGEHFPVYIEGGTVKGRSREPLFHYVMAGVFAAFGTTVTTIRLTSALIGIVTVAVFFLLCERLFGLRVAFIAATLLAVCRWHVTFSRIGLRAITLPLCIVLALVAFSALLRRRTAPSALIFGATLGLGLYSYPSYWIVPAALAVLLLMALWRERRVPVCSVAFVSVLAAGAFLVTAAPLIVYAMRKPDYYFARAVETADPLPEADGSIFTVRDNLQRVLFMLHFRGDRQARHNLPGRPLLDPIMGVAFVIGLYVSLRTLPTDPPRKLGVLLFWLLPLLPSAVTSAAPHAMRSLGAVPAVCLISAMGISAVMDAAGRSAALRAARFPSLLAVAVLAIVTAWNYDDYFREWGHDRVVAEEFSGDIPRFFSYCADLAKENDVYVCPYVYYSPNIQFLSLARQAPLKLIDSEAAFGTDGIAQRDRVFICEEPAVNMLVEKLYPGSEKLGNYSTYGAHTGRMYRVRKEALTRLSAAEQSEIRYFVGTMIANFQVRSRKW